MNHEQIERILKVLGVKNYSINEKGLVDVQGNVDLSDRALTEIPVAFGTVKGDFNCGANELTSLMNTPLRVERDFWCGGNLLESFLFAPMFVGGDFYATNLPELETMMLDTEIKNIFMLTQCNLRLEDLIGVKCNTLILERVDNKNTFFKEYYAEELKHGSILLDNKTFQDAYPKHQLKEYLQKNLQESNAKSRHKI